MLTLMNDTKKVLVRVELAVIASNSDYEWKQVKDAVNMFQLKIVLIIILYKFHLTRSLRSHK